LAGCLDPVQDPEVFESELEVSELGCPTQLEFVPRRFARLCLDEMPLYAIEKNHALVVSAQLLQLPNGICRKTRIPSG